MPFKLRVALAASLCAVPLTGCLETLHPLHSEDVAIFRQELVGSFCIVYQHNAAIYITFESIDDKFYRLTVSGAQEEDQVYSAHLVELGGHMYLDIQLQFDDDDFAALAGAVPVHQIMRIRFNGEHLVTEYHDLSWLRLLLIQHPDQLDHTFIGGPMGRMIITADTEELQQFIIARADDWEIEKRYTWARVEEVP